MKLSVAGRPCEGQRDLDPLKAWSSMTLEGYSIPKHRSYLGRVWSMVLISLPNQLLPTVVGTGNQALDNSQGLIRMCGGIMSSIT